MDLTSMKIDASERSAIEKRYDTMQDEYPCGLCLYLDEDAIAKLGLIALPKVGATLTLSAKVDVTSVSENESTDGKRRSLNLQITAMGLA